MKKRRFIPLVFDVISQIRRGKPFYATLFVTRHCNSKCFFCNVVNNRAKDLSLEEMEEIIDKLYSLGIRIITITGGEPLIREDIFDILKYLERKGIAYTIVSNGTLWDEEKAYEIKKREPLFLSFSLDTLNRKKYKSIRGIDGLPLVKKNMLMLAEIGLGKGFLSTLTTVTDKNINEIFNIIEFDRQIGWKFTCGPVASGENFQFRSDNKALTRRKKFSEVFYKLSHQCKKDNIIIGPSIYYKTIADYFRGNYQVKCDAGKYYLSVDAFGGLSVCQDFPPFTNLLKENNLEDIFENINYRQIRKCALTTPCFYGCTVYISILLQASKWDKLGILLEILRKGIL